MRRIGLTVFLVLSFTVVPLATGAQQASRVPRIGYLSAGAPTTASTFENAFRQGCESLAT